MSKLYSAHTLQGNWQEERSKAPPLRGGVPDYGFKVYTASTAEAYKAPDPTQEYTYPRHRARFGLVCADTLAEAALSYGSGLSSKAGFDTTHGGKDMTPTEVASMYHTTQRDSMALATSIRASAAAAAAKDAHHLEHSIFARAAGGAGSVNHDRGKKTMGIAGEVLRTTDDSRMNTAAQRSWMYGPDPGLSAVANPPAARPEPQGMSLTVGGHPEDSVRRAPPGAAHGRYAAFQGEARCTTDVTATQQEINMLRGKRVFADER